MSVNSRKFTQSEDPSSKNSIPQYTFNIDRGAKEFEWRDALSKELHGKIEQVIPDGRIDIETDTMAIEVEKIDKWHEGLGQSLHYADETRKQGVIALVITSSSDLWKVAIVKRVCNKNNIKLMILKPKEK